MRQRQEVQALLRQKSVETAGTCGGGTGVSREKLMIILDEFNFFVITGANAAVIKEIALSEIINSTSEKAERAFNFLNKV